MSLRSAPKAIPIQFGVPYRRAKDVVAVWYMTLEDLNWLISITPERDGSMDELLRYHDWVKESRKK